LAWWARGRGIGLGHLLSTRSDAVWYLDIARHGYDAGHGQSNLAFFPLYPGMVRGVAQLGTVAHLGGWGVYPGLVIAWTACLAAAWGLFAVGDALYGRRAGVLLAVLWGVLPHAVVENLAYSEGLFTALSAWTLLALLRRNWLIAGVLCLLAGLARPTALALIPVIVIDAAVTVVRDRGGWRPLLGMVLAPLGSLGYLGWVAVRTGRSDGWQHLQRAGWGTSWDWGRDSVRMAGRILSSAQPLELYLVTAVVAVAILLLTLSLFERQPWQLLTFSALVLVMTLGSAGYYHSKARFLLPAFPLLLVVARSLAGTSAPKRAAILAFLAIGSAYFGGYLMLVWRWSP
jgi:hypothetical protein